MVNILKQGLVKILTLDLVNMLMFGTNVMACLRGFKSRGIIRWLHNMCVILEKDL